MEVGSFFPPNLYTSTTLHVIIIIILFMPQKCDLLVAGRTDPTVAGSKEE